MEDMPEGTQELRAFQPPETAPAPASEPAVLSDDAIMRELGHLSALVRRSMRCAEGASHADALLVRLALHEDAMDDGFVSCSLSQVEISDMLGIRPQSVGPIVRQLEERGLIMRVPNEQDKRAYLVQLTEVGRAEAAEARDYQRRYAAWALAVLDADEKATLSSALVKLNEKLG